MRRGGPFGNVQADDPPMSFCPEHNRKYNPYKTQKCPECKEAEMNDDVPVVDPSDFVDD
jgi:hypothetical protein